MKLFGDNGYGAITNDEDRLFQFTDRCNRALDRFVFLAMSADGRWQWDDNNNTDVSIGKTDLVSGQQKYTFALEHLEIERVLILRPDGTWQIINPIDTADRNANTYIENNTGNVGVPTAYDKRGASLIFNVVPNYNADLGIRVFFKRGASYFLSSDTTKVAGFASPFHGYIPLHASMTYAIDRTMPQAKNLFDMVSQEEMAIKQFYSARNKDEVPRLIAGYQNNK